MSAWDIRHGDCREVMAAMAPDSVDAIVCDPPYALTGASRNGSPRSNDPETPFGRHNLQGKPSGGFMGKAWDSEIPGADVWAAALRVAKPGAHLLAFGGTRTFHRLTCAIEDAGWEIRDCLSWLYGQGFPKSHDVSKAIDRAAGHKRGTQPDMRNGPNTNNGTKGDKYSLGYAGQGTIDAGAVSDAARRWSGWGTALKPAWEPIILARKPPGGTVAANVLRHGTGALNIDGCRIAATDAQLAEKYASVQNAGRWPANAALDEEAAAMLDEQSGERAGAVSNGRRAGNGAAFDPGEQEQQPGYADSGGASRFFYTAKASRGEREAGLREAGLREAVVATGSTDGDCIRNGSPRFAKVARNSHPTVKPVDLMRWLVRLVTPPGGLVLDPFTGSGTTGIAAVLEDCRFLGIEREAEYVAIAKARIINEACQGRLFGQNGEA